MLSHNVKVNLRKFAMKYTILNSYGAGNGPDNREDIVREIKLASARGVILGCMI